MTTRAMFRRAVLVMCALACAGAAAAHGHNHGHAHAHTPHAGGSVGTSENPIATTPSGPIRGSMMQTRRGRAFEAYRGMRYAEPPVGELRFQPPKMIEKYEGVLDATQEGPACPLPAPPGYYLDEDCLRINVYTPSHKSKELLPVVVYIHAGGFYAFSGRGDVAGPHYLLDRDIVLVTLNYRLGTLGFLSTGDAAAPGNNGFKDQVAALRWVRRNIAAFGGDPDLVTIAGCSAGSISVMLHMISPMSKGLFHRGISMSGSVSVPVPTPTNLLPLARRQAELVNCPTSPNKAMVDCLKTKPWKELGDSLNGFYEFGFDPVALWWPVIEPNVGQERFLAIEPAVAIRKGRMHAVPHIISQTTDEFFWKAFTILNNQTLLDGMNKEWERIAPISLQLPREGAAPKVNRLRQEYFGNRTLVNDTATAKALGNLYGDAIEAFPVHRMANLMCRHSPYPVYYYEFAYVGNHSHYEDPVTNKPTGERLPLDSTRCSIHCDPNAYGGLDLPELSGLHWPAMTPDKRHYLRVDRTLSIRSNLKEDRIKVWEELYPIKY
ncbi:PREDICTED: esterase FE4-like [Papilio polytes]|uniref:esterase FE4-like n=1 Tax=Papilio polytes TaxID=76194 RepID=UPI0006761C1B|nr:PREDICTED: esterase FE4-like [Papilio polytes]